MTTLWVLWKAYIGTFVKTSQPRYTQLKVYLLFAALTPSIPIISVLDFYGYHKSLWVNPLEAFPVMNHVNNWEHKYSHNTVLGRKVKKLKALGHYPFQNKNKDVFLCLLSFMVYNQSTKVQK